jgi:hypothetical protein
MPSSSGGGNNGKQLAKERKTAFATDSLFIFLDLHPNRRVIPAEQEVSLRLRSTIHDPRSPWEEGRVKEKNMLTLLTEES